MEFTHNGATYIYDLLLINIQQAVAAEEIVTYIAQVRQRNDATLDKLTKTGVFDWFPKCAAALLLQRTETGTEQWSYLAWDSAEQFVRRLPVAEYKRLEGCVEDFFFNTGKKEMLSFALGKNTQAQNLGQLLSLMKQMSGSAKEQK